MYHLINPARVIPGEYSYEQTEVIPRKWGRNPDLNQLAKLVSDFRSGNGLSRDSVAEAQADIIQFNAVRLPPATRARFFYDSDSPNQPPPSVKACSSCGAKV